MLCIRLHLPTLYLHAHHLVGKLWSNVYGHLEQDHLHDNTLLQHMKGFLRLIVTTISTFVFNIVLNTVVCTSASGIIAFTYTFVF